MAKRLIVRRRIDFRVIALCSGKYTRPHRCNTRVHHGSGSGEVRHTRGDTATISTPGSRLVNLTPYGDAASHGTSPISRRGRNERKKGRGGEREREREERCAALADMQIEEVGVRYVTSLGEPWLRGQHLPLLYDYFTRAPSSASCRWNRGRKKRRGVEKTIGER